MPRAPLDRKLELPTDPPDPTLPVFTTASFLSFLNPGSMKFNQNGQLSFILVVPEDEAVQVAAQIHTLLANPIPLETRLQVWGPYADDVADDDARLRLLDDPDA